MSREASQVCVVLVVGLALAFMHIPTGLYIADLVVLSLAASFDAA